MCIFGTKSRWIYIIFIPPWIRCKSILVLFRKIFFYYVHTHGNKNEYLPIQKLKYGYLFFNYGFSLFQAHHYIHIYETFKIYLDYDSFTFKRNYMKPIHFLGAGNGSHRSANRPAQQHVLIWRIRDAILVWAMSDYNTKTLRVNHSWYSGRRVHRSMHVKDLLFRFEWIICSKNVLLMGRTNKWPRTSHTKNSVSLCYI